jgi:hypothetical protein
MDWEERIWEMCLCSTVRYRMGGIIFSDGTLVFCFFGFLLGFVWLSSSFPWTSILAAHSEETSSFVLNIDEAVGSWGSGAWKIVPDGWGGVEMRERIGGGGILWKMFLRS